MVSLRLEMYGDGTPTKLDIILKAKGFDEAAPTILCFRFLFVLSKVSSPPPPPTPTPRLFLFQSLILLILSPAVSYRQLGLRWPFLPFHFVLQSTTPSVLSALFHCRNSV